MIFKKFIVLLMVLTLSLTAMAETKKQSAIVREITHSANDIIHPVMGVRVSVEQLTTNESDKDGRLNLTIPLNTEESFFISKVRMPAGSNYVLASPNQDKKLFLSKNNIEIILISPEDKENEYQQKYKSLLKSYNAKARELNNLRSEFEEQQIELDKNSQEYAKLQEKIDSLEYLLVTYFDETSRKKMVEELERIAEELAMTDYVSLSDLDREIYDLKSQGNWETVSQILNQEMNGDARKYLKEARDERDQLEKMARKAEEKMQTRIKNVKEALSTYRILHIGDSVMKYYDYLIEDCPTNFRLYLEAAAYQHNFNSDFNKAKSYLEKGLQMTPPDSLKYKFISSLGSHNRTLGKYKVAINYYKEALKLSPETSEEDLLSKSLIYNNIASCYTYLDMLDSALVYNNTALSICSPLDYPMENLYMQKGSILTKLGNYDEAVMAYDNAIQDILNTYQLTNGDIYLMEYGTCLSRKGIIMSKLNRFDEAYRLYQESLDVQKKVLGEGDVNIATLYINMGVLKNKIGEYAG